jgi:hypothetical protein
VSWPFACACVARRRRGDKIDFAKECDLVGAIRVRGLTGALAGLLLLLGSSGSGCGGDQFTSTGPGAGEAGQQAAEPTGGQDAAAGQTSSAGGHEAAGGATGGEAGGATGGGSGAEPTGGVGGSVGGASPTGGSSGSAGTVASGGATGAAGGSGGADTGGTGGSAGSHSGGGGTSNTVGASGSGGSGGARPEDCLNGVDDNGDELADCADPLCREGFTCVPPPPDGWNGVGWVTLAPLPTCPDELPAAVDLYDDADLSYSAASCECTCEGPSDVECVADLLCSAQEGCSDMAPGDTVGQSCERLNLSASGSADLYCMLDALRAEGGYCDSSVLVGKEPPAWPAGARACLRESGGSCDGEALCIPLLGPDAEGPCIARGGDQTCPDDYPERLLYHDGSFDDQRGCTACVCEQHMSAECECAAGVECGVGVFGDQQCGSEPRLVPDGACVPIAGLSNQAFARLIDVILTSEGSCAVSSEPEPTGSVLPGGVITVCCQG